MKKILIGMPTLGSIDIKMCYFLYNLIDYYKGKYNISIIHTARSDISMARNNILREIKDEDYLLFLDDDNIPNDITFLEKLVESGKDIISGLVPSRLPDTKGIHRLCVFDEIYKDTGEHQYKQYLNVPEGDDIFKIANCGMGCVLIKSHIIKEVLQHYNTPCQMGEVWYYIIDGKHIRWDSIDFTRVKDGIFRYKRYMSEDLIFFERAKDLLNIDMYAHKGVTCNHIGNPEIITVNKHIKGKNFNLGLTM